MKTSIAIFLVCVGLLVFSCQDRKNEDMNKSAIEGTWSLVYFKWVFPDSTYLEFPGNVKDCTGKWMLSGGNSLWYLKYMPSNSSTYTIEFGDMKYQFDGKIYQETYLSSQDNKFIGQTFHYSVSIKNDTLTLTGPGEGESEKLGCKVIEKFVRK
jgi:hypothetical protein